ncbi:endopeptidase [Priestia aryabhattai]|uniref:C40 family peptidase n=1 Tax=Bacillaceae TaxID=186817 RepID=UPI000B9FD5A5|nr:MULTISPECIES: NlpC/P60 family protein [Bacillaceae]MDT2046093.1 NlpC/P60 family protein [Priestia flexa]OZT11949.1 endopeptidase [Priestia aryabhattai]TDB50203.1 endopeptidase [Bacillus sp. CBEL-1]USY53875.1 NlpC/P60 family protein [Bacillus sp. 1780r2a1]
MKKLVASMLMGGAVLSTPVIGQAASSDELLKQGMKNESVYEVKDILKQEGYLKGEVSTYFNYETKVAVQAFQQDHNLNADGIVGPKTHQELETTGVEEGTSSLDESAVISKAKSLIGTPYKWAGTTPSGFDCSGFLQYVYKESVGVEIPRTVADIYAAGESVKEPSVGDIVYFETYKEGPSHAGIYLGNDQFIHTSTSKGVTISDKNSSYWSERYLGAKRVK